MKSFFPQFDKFKDVFVKKEDILDSFMRELEKYPKQKLPVVKYLRDLINKDEINKKEIFNIKSLYEGSLVLNNVDFINKRNCLRTIDRVIKKFYGIDK